ncbi:MAG: protein kinase [Dermabacter sp.]|nr:protein kinase [Dermabacter sp.]
MEPDERAEGRGATPAGEQTPSSAPGAAPRLHRPGRVNAHLADALADTGYHVQRKIGSGGMGIVYLAQDGDGNDMALKMLRPEIADDPRARARLRREVKALQKMRSDNIARVIDAELDSPEAFVVTEFVAGPTLEDAVRSHGHLHLEAVREIGVVLGETLETIHDQGIVHRDLKPSNIMLRHATPADLTTFDPDAQRLDPVIIDFGIAQAVEDSRLTSTGMMMGTAAYLDPEVVKSNAAGPGADWWAWAGLIAFAATGREPFGSGRADLVFLRADRGDVDVEGLPSALQQWLREALNPDPALRPAPSDLIERLARMDLEYFGPLAGVGAGAAAAGGQASGAQGTGADGAGGTAVIGGTDAAEPRTEVLSPTALHGSDQAGGSRTEVLGAAAGPNTEVLGGAAGPRTEVLGAATGAHTEVLHEYPGGADVPGATEALPTHGEGVTEQQPPTEALPQIREEVPTRPFAPIQDPIAPRASAPLMGPGGVGPANYGAPAQGALVPGGPAMPQAPYVMPLHPQVRPPNKRPFLVGLGAALVIALGALAPLTAVLFFVLLNAFARAWQRSWVALTKARERGAGERMTRAGLATMALPRFAWGILESALLALFPLALAVGGVIAVDAILVWLLHTTLPLAVYGAAITAVTMALCWIGIDSRTTRYGAHRIVDAAAPDALWTAILATLLLVLLGVIGVTIGARGGLIDYFPYVGMFRFEDIAPWRS